MPSQIGTLAEKSLHAALKDHFARPGDGFEVEVDGYVIDIVRPQDGGRLLIEIQSRNFSAIRRKLAALLDAGHAVRLIHPIPLEKWIVREQVSGRQVARRRSPRRGNRLDVFRELVRIPQLLPHPQFSLHVVLTRQEEIWVDDGRGSWRRKGWSIADHRLLAVEAAYGMSSRADFLAALAPHTERPFTNRGLAEALKISTSLAGKITYTLRKAGWLEQVGMQGRAFLFAETKV